jgi:hypothetical protein
MKQTSERLEDFNIDMQSSGDEKKSNKNVRSEFKDKNILENEFSNQE